MADSIGQVNDAKARSSVARALRSSRGEGRRGRPTDTLLALRCCASPPRAAGALPGILASAVVGVALPSLLRALLLSPSRSLADRAPYLYK